MTEQGSTKGLTDRQRKVLFRLLRVAYPHDRFPDAPYERTAKQVEGRGCGSVSDDDLEALAEGLDALDADGDFLALDEEAATTAAARDRPAAVLPPDPRHHGGCALRRPRGLGPARLRGLLVRQGRLHRPRLRRPGLAARPAHHRTGRTTRRTGDRRGGVGHERPSDSTATADRAQRPGRRCHRLRSGRRHDGPRTHREGRAGGRPRGRPIPDAGRLGQRRVARVHPDGMAGQPHHVRIVAGGHRLPQPADLDREGRGRDDHALGGRDAALHGARVPHQDAPTATSTAPTCSTGRSASTTWPPGTTAPSTRWAPPTGTAVRQCRPTTTTRSSPMAPSKAGYRHYATGPYATNAEPYDGRPGSIQDGFNFQGDKKGSKWSTLVREIPRALETGNLDLRPQCQAVRITHDSAGRVDGVEYVDADGAHAQAGRTGRLRRRQLDRVAAVAADERVVAASPTAWPTPPGQVGRNYMRHMTGSAYAHFEQAGAHVPRRDDGRHHRRRGEARPVPRVRGGYYMETLALGPAFLASFVEPGILGTRVHRADGRLREHGRSCGSSARTCPRRATG